MSDGGTLAHAPVTSTAHHHHTASSPALTKHTASTPSHPAGLPSSEFHVVLPAPTKLHYEGKRVAQVLSKQAARKASLATSPAAGDLSPQKSTRRGGVRSSTRNSSMEPWSMGKRRLDFSQRDSVTPIAATHSSPHVNNRYSSNHSNSNSNSTSASNHLMLTKVLSSPVHATAPERGIPSFPNPVEWHGQLQELLKIAYEMGLVKEDEMEELKKSTSYLFKRYATLILEMQNPSAHDPTAPTPIIMNKSVHSSTVNSPIKALAMSSSEDKDQSIVNDPINSSTQLVADHLDGSSDPNKVNLDDTADVTVIQVETTGPINSTTSAGSSNNQADGIDIHLQSPLPDNLFYSSSSSSTMPSTTSTLPYIPPPPRQTLRKSFKLTPCLITESDDFADAMVELESSTSPNRRQVRAKRAILSEVNPLCGDENSVVPQIVTSLPSEFIETSDLTPIEGGLSPTNWEYSNSARPHRKEASYIVSTRVTSGDPLAGAKFNWEAREYEISPAESIVEKRHSFVIESEDQSERDMVQVEWVDTNNENSVAHTHSTGVRSFRNSRRPSKLLHAHERTYAEISLSNSKRPSFSISQHDYHLHGVEDGWTEDHSERTILAPLQLHGVNSVHTPSRPMTPRSGKSIVISPRGSFINQSGHPLSPRSPMSPRGSFIQSMTPRRGSINSTNVLPPPILHPLQSSPSKSPSDRPSHNPLSPPPAFLVLRNPPSNPLSPRRSSSRTSIGIRRGHVRSQTFSSLSLVPELTRPAPIPPFDINASVSDTLIEDESSTNPHNGSSTIVPALASPSASIDSIQPVTSLVSEDPHLAAVRRARARESRSVSRRENDSAVDHLLDTSPPRPTPTNQTSSPSTITLSQVPIENTPTPSASPSSAALLSLLKSSIRRSPSKKHATFADDIHSSSSSLSSPTMASPLPSSTSLALLSSSSPPSASTSLIPISPHSLSNLRNELHVLRHATVVLGRELDVAHAQQVCLSSYLSQLRHRFMQRPFTVIKFHHSALGRWGAALWRQTREKRHFALSLDGTQLWWSRTPDMGERKSLDILSITDLKLSLIGLFQSMPGDSNSLAKSSTSGEFSLKSHLTPLFDRCVTYDVASDEFHYPPKPDGQQLFQARRAFYDKIITSVQRNGEQINTNMMAQLNESDSNETDVDAKLLESSPIFNSPPPSKHSNLPISFFPSPLRIFHAAHWRCSFVTKDRSLDIIFQTKSDLDIWVEFIQRIMAIKHHKRMVEYAENWRIQQRQAFETSPEKAMKNGDNQPSK